jgi:hypothetical protein
LSVSTVVEEPSLFSMAKGCCAATAITGAATEAT